MVDFPVPVFAAMKVGASRVILLSLDSIEDIKSKDNKWKNKLVSENVVQSTLHFQRRTQKLSNAK